MFYKVPYKDEIEREQLFKEQRVLNNIPIEEQNVFEGNFLIFECSESIENGIEQIRHPVYNCFIDVEDTNGFKP